MAIEFTAPAGCLLDGPLRLPGRNALHAQVIIQFVYEVRGRLDSNEMVVRTYEQECAFVKQVDGTSYSIGKGFVDNMNVPGHFYVNQELKSLLFEELRQFSSQVPLVGTWRERA